MYATTAAAAVAFWASSGALAFVDTKSRAPYVGVLPPIWWLAAAILVAIAAAVVLGRIGVSPADISPLWWSAILVAPWVPLPWPAAVFLWTGRVASGCGR